MILCAYNPKEDSVDNLLDRFYQVNLTRKLRKLSLLNELVSTEEDIGNVEKRYLSDEEILASLV